MRAAIRTFLILSFAVVSALGQTTVRATFRSPTGDLVSGYCTIQAIGSFTSSSYRIVGSPVTVSFTAGSFSVSLTPTDTATPSGQYYKTTCQVRSQTVNGHGVGPYGWDEIWLVPTSAVPLDIAAVVVTKIPTLGLQILPAQIAQGGAQTNQAMCWNGSSWAPGACGGGGGGGMSATVTWAQIEIGVTGSGSVTSISTWQQIEQM